MRAVLVVGVLGMIVVSGCAGTWKKPGATTADFDRDLDECTAAAREAVLYERGPGERERLEDRTHERRRARVDICLEARGWHSED